MYKPIPGGSFEVIDGLKCWVPPIPPLHTIDGYGLPPEEQYFRRTDFPEWWQEERELEQWEESRADLQKIELLKKGKPNLTPEERNFLESDVINEKCEAFRQQEWGRRKNGYWFFNNGKPTYITGAHYYYANWIRIPSATGFPDYMEVTRKNYYFRQYCLEDPFCLGYLIVGIRGVGKTTEEGAFALENLTKTPAMRVGVIQSKSENDAKQKVFVEKIVPMYQGLPDFFQPISDHGSSPEGKLSWKRPSVTGREAKKVTFNSGEELRNMFYPTNAKEKALDGGTFAVILEDELGKCLSPETQVLMHDGSVKMAKDVQVGDLLMGDDSQPREVLSLLSGRQPMYRVESNKWDSWECNENHILSLKSAYNRGGFKLGQTVNVTVKEFLSWPKTVQRHMMLYKVGVEYPAQSHEIDPYMLGLWLGDGHKRGFIITSADQEIFDYVKNYCSVNGFGFSAKEDKRSKGCHRLSVLSGSLEKFRNIDVLLNKHIPDDYLIDSRENRLKLLAGLIDSDGNLNIKGGGSNFEITQKIKELSEDIQRLAESLGFGSSLKTRTATMKRKNRPVYKSKVYRVNIFGNNLHEIPCLLPRKKAPVKTEIHKNTRNPLRSGFKLTPLGEGDFCGFTITGNRLFLLADHQVTHNTDPKKEADVSKRAQVNFNCVWRFGKKVGIIQSTTTVEEMDAGGKECKIVWDNSDQTSIELGKEFTVSGRYRRFYGALDADPQFLDRHGFVDRKKAKEWHDAERAKREDPRELASWIRKMPYDADEAFYESQDQCQFNAMILNKRKIEVKTNNRLIERGDLEWSDGPFSKVIWRPNNVNGWFSTWWLPDDPDFTNRVECYGVSDGSDGIKEGTPLWRPKNGHKMRAGADPIQYGTTVDKKRSSKPVTYAKRLFDPAVDYGALDANGELTLDQMIYNSTELYENGKLIKPKYPYRTGLDVMQYDHRPTEPILYYQAMLKFCFFWGCPILIEAQKAAGLITYFKMMGCADFIMKKVVLDPDLKKQAEAEKFEGNAATVPDIQNYTGLIATDVQYFGHRYFFVEMIENLLKFDPKKTTEYDYAVAKGWTEMACKKADEAPPPRTMDIGELFDRWNNEGSTSTLMI